MTDLVGSIGTGTGRTVVTLRSRGDDVYEVHVYARWMGDAAPLDVRFTCRLASRASHYETLEVTSAGDADGADIPLPPFPDDLRIEVIRVPLQEVDEPFAAVLWLHPQSFYDPGDQLPPEEYDVPPEHFRRTAKALQYLESPWKLAPTMS